MCFAANVHRHCCHLQFFLLSTFSTTILCYASLQKQKRKNEMKTIFSIQLGLSLSNNGIMTDHSVLRRKIEFNTS